MTSVFAGIGAIAAAALYFIPQSAQAMGPHGPDGHFKFDVRMGPSLDRYNVSDERYIDACETITISATGWEPNMEFTLLYEAAGEADIDLGTIVMDAQGAGTWQWVIPESVPLNSTIALKVENLEWLMTSFYSFRVMAVGGSCTTAVTPAAQSPGNTLQQANNAVQVGANDVAQEDATADTVQQGEPNAGMPVDSADFVVNVEAVGNQVPQGGGDPAAQGAPAPARVPAGGSTTDSLPLLAIAASALIAGAGATVAARRRSER